ncbi:MAG: polyisoprenyl-teichoic acid--peptidoglycan teichoic acid transferase [Gaiellales bacterium]|nr:polyisoprenyl-teichoic acid--peptidoglycan teichoic acid transferase [Gaiellales bacterium]
MNNDENASGSATQTPPSDFEPPSLRPPPITVYKARRPRKGFGWKRAILWTFGAVLAIAIGVAGVTAWFVYSKLEKVTNLTSRPDLQAAAHHLDLPIAGKPVTVLLLGYDHRSWEKTTQSRSDTMILMRLDPQRHSLTVLSMPRDMLVSIPGHGQNKLNAAYSFGGADLALQTVRQTLAVKINYLITVDFTGFRRIVDHVGCVFTDVERRYFNQNGLAGSGDYSNIDLKAGYQSLCGAQALSYVRFRHDDNDIFRITRQQAFLHELKHKLDLTTIGTNFVSLVNDVADNVKIVSQFKHKPGPNTLIGFARALASVPKSRTLQLKLLGDQGANSSGGSYVDVGTPEIQSTVAEFLNPNFGQSTAAANVGGKLVGRGAAKKKAKPAISPKLLKVVTLNGSGVELASATAATALRNVGYTHAAKGILAKTGTGNTVTASFQTTKVYYTSKRAESAASKLRVALFDADMAPAPAMFRHTTPGADVVVVVGKNFDATQVKPTTPAPPPTTSQPAAVSPMDPTLVKQFRFKQKYIHYPVLVPKVVPTGTTFGEPDSTDGWLRHYRAHGDWMLHATAYTSRSTAGVWDLQWTKWTTAPILDGPTQQRIVPRKGGRLWKLYLNGAHIHRLAVFYGPKHNGVGRYVVWIDNTLGDALTNKTMVAIARSLHAVPLK